MRAILRERDGRSATATSRCATGPASTLPRAQGQRAGAPLPVACRRGDGHPPRPLRTRLCADRGASRRPDLLREVDDAEADDLLLRKAVAADGLSRLRPDNSLKCQDDRRDADGVARAPAGRRRRSSRCASRAGRRRSCRSAIGRADPRRARGRPGARSLGAARDHHRRRGDLPVAARSGQRPRSGEAAVRLRLRLGGLQAGPPSLVRATTRCRSCGATGSWPASTRSSTGRPARSSSTACGWKTEALARRRGLR